MSTKKTTIVFEREPAFASALIKMHVIINDIISIDLENGQIKTVNLPLKKKGCVLHIKDHIFNVVNLNQVKKIVLRFGYFGIQCSILYKNGHTLDAANKNPSADTTKTIWIIILLLFVVMPLISGVISLIPLLFMW